MWASFWTSGAGANAWGGFIASAIRLLMESLGTAATFAGPEQKERKGHASGALLGAPCPRSCRLPALLFLAGGRFRDSINICCPLVLTMWTSLQICWNVI